MQYLQWSKSRPEASYASRGLVMDSPAFGTDLLLALEHVGTKVHYRDWLESLWPSYLATAQIFHAFDIASCDEERREIVACGTSEPLVNPQAVAGLAMLVGEGRAAA